MLYKIMKKLNVQKHTEHVKLSEFDLFTLAMFKI